LIFFFLNRLENECDIHSENVAFDKPKKILKFRETMEHSHPELCNI